MRVTKLRFFPALLRRPFFGARFSSCPQDFGIPVGEHRACIKTSKMSLAGSKIAFFGLYRGLSRLRRRLRGCFTATSRQLHSNFTATSHELRRHFTATSHELHTTSQTSHRFTITKSVTKLRRDPARLGGVATAPEATVKRQTARRPKLRASETPALCLCPGLAGDLSLTHRSQVPRLVLS